MKRKTTLGNSNYSKTFRQIKEKIHKMVAMNTGEEKNVDIVEEFFDVVHSHLKVRWKTKMGI